MDGRIFINRPPKQFSILLNILRCDGALILPMDEQERFFLETEVEFYKLKEYFEKISPIDLLEDILQIDGKTNISQMEEEEKMIFRWKLSNDSMSTISKGGFTLTHGNIDQFDRAFGDKAMKKPEKYYFEILLKTLPKGSGETFVGVTDNLKNKSSRNNITMQLGGNYRNNCTGNCKILNQGDTVGVLVDFSMNVVKFFTNGQYNGVSGFIKSTQTFYPVCHYFFSGDEYVLSTPPVPIGH